LSGPSKKEDFSLAIGLIGTISSEVFMDRTFDLNKYLHPRTYEKTRLPVEQALTLPPAIYRERDFYQIEQDAIYGRAWVCIGYTCQIDSPGKMLTATVANQPIVITRDREGNIRGFYNVCRHRGSVLITEDKKYERFRCPYHSWTYDLSGKLQNCPLFTSAKRCQDVGKEDGKSTSTFNKEDYGLLPIRVETFGCFIFVNLDNDAEPLPDFLGDLPYHYKNYPLEELVLVKRKTYTIQSNWKLIAENFLEYYHLPWVHPELCEVAAVDMHKRNQGAGMYMSFYASPLLKGSTPLDADYLPAMPNLSPLEANSGYFPYIFPNVAMFLLPHHLFVLTLKPQSIDLTLEYGDILVHPKTIAENGFAQKLDEIFRFYDMVNIQDIMAVERVQQGICAKAYPGGRMTYRFEEPVHRFQNMVIDYLTGERRQYQGD
jgi:choline monooxygenase